MSGEVSGRVLHCERPVKIRSRTTGWSGDFEHEAVSMTCESCGADLLLTIKTDVGPPIGVAG